MVAINLCLTALQVTYSVASWIINGVPRKALLIKTCFLHAVTLTSPSPVGSTSGELASLSKVLRNLIKTSSSVFSPDNTSGCLLVLYTPLISFSVILPSPVLSNFWKALSIRFFLLLLTGPWKWKTEYLELNHLIYFWSRLQAIGIIGCESNNNNMPLSVVSEEQARAVKYV